MAALWYLSDMQIVKEKKSQNSNPGNADAKAWAVLSWGDVGQCLSNEYSFVICAWKCPDRQCWRHKRGWKDFKRIPAFFFLLQCVHIKEKGRKEQPKPILCESIAEKDADSIKDSKFCRAWNYQMMISELTAENCFLLLGWFGSIVLAFALYPTG